MLLLGRVELVGSLDSLLHCHWVSIQDLYLRHMVDNLEAVVGFLCEGVAEQVQLGEEGELLEKLHELVQVPQSVTLDQQCLQELELLYSLDLVQQVVLAVDMLDPEVLLESVQVFQLEHLKLISYFVVIQPYHF